WMNDIARHFRMLLHIQLFIWSGQLDSNQRPAVPKTAALPGCAIPRSILGIDVDTRLDRRLQGADQSRKALRVQAHFYCAWGCFSTFSPRPPWPAPSGR